MSVSMKPNFKPLEERTSAAFKNHLINVKSYLGSAALSDLAEETFSAPVAPPSSALEVPKKLELPKDDSKEEKARFSREKVVYSHLMSEYDRMKKERKEQLEEYQKYRDKVQKGFYMMKLYFGESENLGFWEFSV